MNVKETKKQLRKAISQLKKEHSTEWRYEASLNIMQQIESMDLFTTSNTILLYHALADEVQTSYLLNKYHNTKRLALPVVVDDSLELRVYSPNDVREGYQNILEPTEGELVNPSELDLALIPGIAFDNELNRMGRGGGFYDRLLPEVLCTKIGLAYSFQLVKQIPTEPFDIKVNKVIHN